MLFSVFFIFGLLTIAAALPAPLSRIQKRQSTPKLDFDFDATPDAVRGGVGLDLDRFNLNGDLTHVYGGDTGWDVGLNGKTDNGWEFGGQIGQQPGQDIGGRLTAGKSWDNGNFQGYVGYEGGAPAVGAQLNLKFGK